MMRISY